MHSLALLLAQLLCARAAMPKFPSSGLHPFPSSGLAGVDGRIAAMGDFNGDRMTDLFVVASDQLLVSVYAWNPKISQFIELPGTRAALTVNGKPIPITNVIASDFDYDGRLDFVLFGQTDPSDRRNYDIHFELFVGNGNDHAAAVETSKSIAHQSQPFVADFTGNMRASLIGHHKSNPTQLSVWTFDSLKSAFQIEPFLSLNSLSGNQAANQTCRLAHPHSSAFVDLNGDCLADIFLDCDNGNDGRGYQIWTNTKDRGFQLALQQTFPPGTGQISFADMDADGAIDMVFAACPSESDCTINIAYNIQMGVCSGSESGSCRDPRNLCVEDEDFYFTFSPKSPSFSSMPISSMWPNEMVLSKDMTFKGTLPIPLRIGDYNNDGYPDLLIVTQTRGDPRKTSLRLLKSVACDKSCKAGAADLGRRTLSSVTGATTALAVAQPKIVISAFFMDLDEDGTLDFMLSVREGDGSVRTQAFINNYFNDAFFLKAIGPVPFPDPKPYGVNYVGTTLKYTVLDPTGKRRATQAAQMPQSAYMALDTPYTLLGLGRTNNYIEDLFVGVARRTPRHVAAYHSVIPNSQLVIVPYERDAGAGPDRWKLELYMNPGSSASALLLVLTGSLVLLGSIVWILDWAEKREDEIERKRVLHAINFDAL
eukprot:jgi/Hompol1/5531/HPOL_004510-RA